MPDWLIAIILGLVEGITEFIPVSSTGHLILAGHLLGFEGDRASTFEIFIQLGAILAVVFLYWDRFVGLIPTRLEMKPEQGFSGLRGLVLLALTTVPAVALGGLGHDIIKNDLFSPSTVAVGLAVGGVAILLIEPRLPPSKMEGLDAITWRAALLIGLFQCLSLWPGMSRSAMTILGAMIIGIERKTAAEYSFFVAVPALCAAVGYDMLKSISSLQWSDGPMFAIGFVVAFISAWWAIKGFIRLVGTRSLQPFGWYRIILAGIVLIVLL